MLGCKGEILILTGPPGAGKTTVAAALARTSGSSKVHLHADDFWRSIGNGAVPPHLPESDAQNRVVMDVLSRAASAYAEGGYFVILDGIIGPWFLSPFQRLQVPIHYVVLRPPLDTAIRRCRRRGGETLADPAAITLLHQQFDGLGSLETHVLAVDRGIQPHQLVSRIASIVISRSNLLGHGDRYSADCIPPCPFADASASRQQR